MIAIETTLYRLLVQIIVLVWNLHLQQYYIAMSKMHTRLYICKHRAVDEHRLLHFVGAACLGGVASIERR